MSEEFKPTRFVVVGRGRARVAQEGGKKSATLPAIMLRRVMPDGALSPKDEVYTSKLLRGKGVGLVYEMEASDESIKPATVRFIERWHDEEQVAEWQLAAKAHDAVQDAERRERDAAAPLALELLRPLRRAYAKTNWNGKMAIEVLVLNYLRMDGAQFADREERERPAYTVESSIRRHFEAALLEFMDGNPKYDDPGAMTPADWWSEFLNSRLMKKKSAR